MSGEVVPRAARALSLVLTAIALIIVTAACAVVLPRFGLPAWFAGLGALGALIPLALLYARLRHALSADLQAQHSAEAQRVENDRNQQAIMRLLDEMSNLAEGDLTVQATVSEDITGAIADSVNYAVEALRKLVTTINQSAIQLDGAARQTQALASHLARASNAQSKQVGAATESIGAVASSIEEVSGNAERAADVARH